MCQLCSLARLSILTAEELTLWERDPVKLSRPSPGSSREFPAYHAEADPPDLSRLQSPSLLDNRRACIAPLDALNSEHPHQPCIELRIFQTLAPGPHRQAINTLTYTAPPSPAHDSHVSERVRFSLSGSKSTVAIHTRHKANEAHMVAVRHPVSRSSRRTAVSTGHFAVDATFSPSTR